ncbi:bifunctional diguanylate cyclase/phosphodiesterase [Luteimonas deserti]|uniref:EAL domain-containing protein n=1 Tax=Luteimonas deserti TaxID=2752306 RepID=A0A7Z0QM91_9GAMM|nr:EAL domain-containing protein [Luteimonas deserti]NYZ61241.1 EAL domain-containing protein [Luteimonas deserti]
MSPLPQGRARGGLLAAWPPAAMAAVVLLAGLVVTAALCYREWRMAEARADALHASLADAAEARLHDPLDAASVALRAMQTVFLSHVAMDQAAFARYQANLRAVDELPGYRTTGFARYRPPAPGAPPSYRYELVTPIEGNEAVMGIDIARQPANLRALERARDSDTVVMSAPFRLAQAQEADSRALGVTLRLPVYSPGQVPADPDERRAREVGALAISLQLDPMVRAALQGRILEFLHVDIRDLDTGPEPAVVFAGGPLPAHAGTPLVRELQFGGRRWEVRMHPLERRPGLVHVRSTAVAGALITVLLSMLLWSVAGTHRRALALGQRMSARFSESEARFRTLNELLPVLVLLADAPGQRITYANQAARQRLGDVVGTPLPALFADPRAREAMPGAGVSGGWDGHEVAIGQAGRAFWARVSLAQVVVDGAPHLLLTATDISEHRELTERLSYQATHDALTELCNRREFERRLSEALRERAVDPQAPPFALLYFDLDQFKVINDLSGHIAGDQLLVELVLALRLNLREGDMLARLGGDEFGLLAFDVDEAMAVALGERLRRCIDTVRFVWQGRTYSVSASIGVVLADRPGISLKDVMAWADSACYQAKEAGRNRVHVYREDDDSTRRLGEMEWVNRLRAAMEQDRLLLDYQEIVPVGEAAGAGAHAELLLRLRDESGDEIMPGSFLPAAERYGLMPAVDRWVIRTAVANFARLHPRGEALRTCAINLSGASIEDEDLADFILACIAEHGVPAERFCLEITETVAVRSLLKVAAVIARLREAGCRIALDDFGAGMSSFGYLKNLPVDLIKIDGSFIRELDEDPMSRTIVSAIVQIGHQRGLKVVAEWVDNARVLEILAELGVDYAQGFALHRPQRVVFQR